MLDWSEESIKIKSKKLNILFFFVKIIFFHISSFENHIFLFLISIQGFHPRHNTYFFIKKNVWHTLVTLTFLMQKIPVTITLFPGTTLSHRYLRIIQISFNGWKILTCILFAVELHVSGNLTLRYRIRQLLQFDDLVVNAHAVVWHNKKRIQWALGRSRLIPGKKIIRNNWGNNPFLWRTGCISSVGWSLPNQAWRRGLGWRFGSHGTGSTS